MSQLEYKLVSGDVLLGLEPLLTRKEVCKILSNGLTTLAKLRRLKLLVPVKTGRRLGYDPADVRAYREKAKEAAGN